MQLGPGPMQLGPPGGQQATVNMPILQPVNQQPAAAVGGPQLSQPIELLDAIKQVNKKPLKALHQKQQPTPQELQKIKDSLLLKQETKLKMITRDNTLNNTSITDNIDAINRALKTALEKGEIGSNALNKAIESLKVNAELSEQDKILLSNSYNKIKKEAETIEGQLQVAESAKKGNTKIDSLKKLAEDVDSKTETETDDDTFGPSAHKIEEMKKTKQEAIDAAKANQIAIDIANKAANEKMKADFKAKKEKKDAETKAAKEAKKDKEAKEAKEAAKKAKADAEAVAEGWGGGKRKYNLLKGGYQYNHSFYFNHCF